MEIYLPLSVQSCFQDIEDWLPQFLQLNEASCFVVYNHFISSEFLHLYFLLPLDNLLWQQVLEVDLNGRERESGQRARNLERSG